MNANEVIAALAGEGVHANDDVNMGQQLERRLPLRGPSRGVGDQRRCCPHSTPSPALEPKAGEFDGIVKSGRTHLMDAMPITLDQEFGGCAAQMRQGIERLEDWFRGSAGSRSGAPPSAPGSTRTRISPPSCATSSERETGLTISPPADPFEAQAPRHWPSRLSGQLKVVAVSLTKIANDLRWMKSGPRAGLAEIFVALAAARQLDHARQGESGHPAGSCAGATRRSP